MSRKVLHLNVPSLIRQKEERLKLSRRLTQREMAEAIGVSEQTMGRWVRGEVGQFTLEQLERFLAYFECDIDELLKVEEVPD